MALRNLTARYEEFRKTSRSRVQAEEVPDDIDLIDKRIDVLEEPEWASVVQEIHQDLMQIKGLLTELNKAHNEHLKVNFGAKQKSEQRIDELTSTIKASLQKCKQATLRLANSAAEKTQSERMVILNVMKGIGVLLNERGAEFRREQKDYFARVTAQEELGALFGSPGGTNGQEAFLEGFENGFAPEQQERMQELQRNASVRQAEILKIAQSVNELHSLFNEVHVLVIEQGTILDRIDYNIEQTLAHVVKGKQELIEANKYSKKALKMKCIIALIVLVLIESIILAVKVKSMVDPSGGGGGGGGGGAPTPAPTPLSSP